MTIIITIITRSGVELVGVLAEINLGKKMEMTIIKFSEKEKNIFCHAGRFV